MTRRALLFAAAISSPRLQLPIRLTFDAHAKLSPAQLDLFHKSLWPETLRGFASAGVSLQVAPAAGYIRRLPSGTPMFTHLDRGAINLIVTSDIPLHWDQGRGLAGVSLLYDRSHLCLIALRRAHPHHVPFLSVNTVLHELHVILEDVYVQEPSPIESSRRELRADLAATRLWLFPSNPAVAEYVRRFLPRLHAA
jgi:hypothetical protein